MAATTIQISQDLQEELKKMKLYPRETYEEVIWGAIERNKELSDETIKAIEEGRKQIARGETITLSEYKKKHGLK